MFTETEQIAIINAFAQAWPEVEMYMDPSTDRASAAVDVMRDHATQVAGITRDLNEQEDEWLLAKAAEYV